MMMDEAEPLEESSEVLQGVEYFGSLCSTMTCSGVVMGIVRETSLCVEGRAESLVIAGIVTMRDG